MTMMRLQTSERWWRIYTDKHILSRCSRGSRWDDLIPLVTRIKCSGFISSCKSSHQDQWRLLFSWTHTDCRLPSFLPPPPPLLSLFQADLIWSALSVPLSFVADSSSLRPLYLLGVLSAPPEAPLGPAGLQILHPPSAMRSLMESSWMKFGPAGRDSLDWSPGPSALPSTDRQATVSPSLKFIF